MSLGRKNARASIGIVFVFLFFVFLAFRVWGGKTNEYPNQGTLNTGSLPSHWGHNLVVKVRWFLSVGFLREGFRLKNPNTSF